MNIFDHLLDERKIIGISPLSTHGSSTHGPISYSFRVYLESNTVLIISPDYKEENEGWKTEYIRVRNMVADQIKELNTPVVGPQSIGR